MFVFIFGDSGYNGRPMEILVEISGFIVLRPMKVPTSVSGLMVYFCCKSMGGDTTMIDSDFLRFREGCVIHINMEVRE